MDVVLSVHCVPVCIGLEKRYLSCAWIRYTPAGLK